MPFYSQNYMIITCINKSIFHHLQKKFLLIIYFKISYIKFLKKYQELRFTEYPQLSFRCTILPRQPHHQYPLPPRICSQACLLGRHNFKAGCYIWICCLQCCWLGVFSIYVYDISLRPRHLSFLTPPLSSAKLQ